MAQEIGALRTVVALLAGALLLCGCPAPRPRPDTQSATLNSPDLEPSPAPRAPAPPRENRLSPATRALVTQAQGLATRGDFDGASSTLDRALRIEPANPLLWIERGRIRLSENDAHQAESCGRKALALASGDRRAQVQAGRLLADALRAQRRNQEAAELERQPFMH